MEKCMADIAKTGYSGELTFELSVKSKPGRNENDRYASMGPKAYIKEAYERAVRVRDIFDSEKIKNIFNTDEAKEIEYIFEYEQNIDRHPNAVDFTFEGDINMKVSGNSVGAGNVEITKIEDFSTKISGEYNTLLLFYKDKVGMISKVSTLIQKEKINIASLDCDRNARGKIASMCICIDGEISENIINQIKQIEDVYFVRNIRKLEA